MPRQRPQDAKLYPRQDLAFLFRTTGDPGSRRISRPILKLAHSLMIPIQDRKRRVRAPPYWKYAQHLDTESIHKPTIMLLILDDDDAGSLS
jgi:hypothetical protein